MVGGGGYGSGFGVDLGFILVCCVGWCRLGGVGCLGRVSVYYEYYE